MNELEGLNLIDKNGDFHGIIEKNVFDNNLQKHFIHYKTDNGYDTVAMDIEKFQSFNSYVKIKSDRYDLIRSKGIGHLYHFSPIENAPSILNMGILSRKYANDIKLPIMTTDPNRRDGKLDMISASISYPNYKMRYKLEQSGMNLVIYDISPKILLAKLDTEFYYTNAANAIFALYDKEELKSNAAFASMFDKTNREPNLPYNYPTDPQAEVLINHRISKDYINMLILPTSDSYLERLCEEADMDHVVTRKLSLPRCDWRRW